MTVKEVLKSMLFHADDCGEEWQDDAKVELCGLGDSLDDDLAVLARTALRVLSEKWLICEVEHLQAIDGVLHISINQNEKGENTK